MEFLKLDRTWWFKTGITVLTLLTAYGLFKLAGLWAYESRSFFVWTIFVLCVLGIERIYSGFFGIWALLRAAPDTLEQ